MDRGLYSATNKGAKSPHQKSQEGAALHFTAAGSHRSAVSQAGGEVHIPRHRHLTRQDDAQGRLPASSYKRVLGITSTPQSGCHSGLRLVAPQRNQLEWQTYNKVNGGHPDRDGRERYRLGSSDGRQGGLGQLATVHITAAVKSTRVPGGAVGSRDVQGGYSGKNSANSHRQCVNVGQHQSLWRSDGRADKDSESPVEISVQAQCDADCSTSSRGVEFSRGQTVAAQRPLRLDASSRHVSDNRQTIRTPHSGQIRVVRQCSASTLQQQILGSQHRGHRCLIAEKLATRKQLLLPAVAAHTTGIAGDQGSAGSCNHRGSSVGGTAVVSEIERNADSATYVPTATQGAVFEDRDCSRAASQQSLEDSSFPSLWEARLIDGGWSADAAARIQFAWATSTKQTYSSILGKFKNFCQQHEFAFPPADTSALAEFLCTLADSTPKPNSQIRVAEAAIGNLYKAAGLRNMIDSIDIRTLVSALVKSGTTQPMARTSVMPIEPFTNLFLSWPQDEHLDLCQLRLKTITLLALAVCLRPSDIAPKSVCVDKGTRQQSRIVFSRNLVGFHDNGATITLFGIKNDASRQGFKVNVPHHPNIKLCPVRALQHYMDRTQHLVGPDNAVFVSVRPPHTALTANSIGNIMRDAIRLAGLPDHYTPKYFRPTGATRAIEAGQDPEVVRKVGRWKTSQVFYEHYVHSCTPQSFITAIIPDH